MCTRWISCSDSGRSTVFSLHRHLVPARTDVGESRSRCRRTAHTETGLVNFSCRKPWSHSYEVSRVDVDRFCQSKRSEKLNLIRTEAGRMTDEVMQTSEAIPRINTRVEPDTPDFPEDFETNPPQRRETPRRRRHGYLLRLSFILVVLVLLASGLVPVQDVLFAGMASAYFYAFAKLVYPSPTKERPPTVFPRNSWVGSFVAFAGVISIPIPAVYILGSFFRGDQAAMKSASPHLFLMTCQVLTEIFVVSVSTPVSLPVRAFVPIVYNTRRLFTIAAWLEAEFARDRISLPWTLFGRGIAAANMAVWTFNLLCFLLPVYHPMVMRKHFELEQLHKAHHS